MENHDEIIKEFKGYFENQSEEINPSFQKSTIINLQKFQEMILENKDLEETALDKKLDKSFKGKFKKKSSNNINELIKDKDLGESLKKIGVLSETIDDVLIVRKMPHITQEQYDKLEQEYIFKDNQNILKSLYDYLAKLNCNFKSPSCFNSVGGINPLSYLIEYSFHMNQKKVKEMEEKFNILHNYIYNYREINGDGNCFYRAIMFRYIEILILNENISIFQRFIFDIIESFKSEEIQQRRIVNNNDIKPNLTFQILFLLINLLKQKKVKEAHKLFVKCISTCKKFDYCLILYLRYILYKYIKQNENKLYTKNFPLKIGNLLPQQFETEKGDFLFDSFYKTYLLKFFTDAEKIIIYLTPFVLGIQLNIVVYDIVDEEILQKLEWEGESDIKSKDVITLLNNNNHYSIVYTENDYKQYENIFEFYLTNIKSVIMNKSVAPNLVNYEVDDNLGTNEFLKREKINNINNIHVNNNNIKKENTNQINNIQKNENKIKENNSNKIENEKNVNKKDEERENNINININQEKNSNNIYNINNKINNNILNEYEFKEQNEKPDLNLDYINGGDLRRGVNIHEGKNILNIKTDNKLKKHYENKDNNMIMKSKIVSVMKNLDNNIDNDLDVKNSLINREDNTNNKIEKQSQTQKKIKEKLEKNKDVTKDKSQEKKSKINLKDGNIKEEKEEKAEKEKDVKILRIEIKKRDRNKDKDKNNKSYTICKNCNTEIKINELNPLCKNCFKNVLIQGYYDSIQYEKDPITNIYLSLNGKGYNLEEIINLYNKSYEGRKLVYQEVLKNIKDKKCILCHVKNTIPLPCKCCYFCEHLNSYFNKFELKNAFICPSKIKYSRKNMLKLGILIQNLNNWKNDKMSIIKYFERRLLSNCCHCGANLDSEKFIIKVYDSKKNEDTTKFLSKINHYLCQNCLKANIEKEFNCKICQIPHLDKNE